MPLLLKGEVLEYVKQVSRTTLLTAGTWAVSAGAWKACAPLGRFAASGCAASAAAATGVAGTWLFSPPAGHNC